MAIKMERVNVLYKTGDRNIHLSIMV